MIGMPTQRFMLVSLLFAVSMIATTTDAFAPLYHVASATSLSKSRRLDHSQSLLFQSKSENNIESAVIFELATERVKIGALRFLLQLELVSQSQQLWVPQQGHGEGELKVYFHDGTGMISIELQPDRIRMIRNGQSPSLPYQLQESVLLHSLLDELENLVEGGEEKVEKEKRLLVLKDDASIDEARAKLPARRE